MPRPSTVLAAAAAALVGLAVLVPAAPSVAAPAAPAPDARWVNDVLRVTYPFVMPSTPVDDAGMRVEVDGRLVGQDEPGRTGDVWTLAVHRTASAGPAHVRVLSEACVDGSEGEQCVATPVWSATVARHVVRAKHGQTSAFALLAALPVRKEAHAASYARSRFTLWIDADHDGEDTRAEVLKAESRVRVTESAHHVVRRGRWVSPYDEQRFTSASGLDIDHLVPLEEAWTSGASAWSARKREAYANDLGFGPSLVAVSRHANRSKGDADPTGWLPPRAASVCGYVRNWIAVKSRWGLSVDPAEKAALAHDLVARCGNPYVTKPGKPDVAALVGTTTHAGSGSSGGGSTGGGGASRATGLDPRYPTCTELLRHANHAPYRRGVDPEYAWYQDRDGDGLVCE
jgi:hypothetical protein